MLTKKQKELLIFIHERLQRGEIVPSFEEMKQALGLKSKSGIYRLINALVERGYIDRIPHKARALEIRRLPEGYKQAVSSSQAVNDSYGSQTVSIPLYGRIAAGTPIEAIRDEAATVDVPPALVGAGEFYALEVDGDSMIKAGINDGDTVVIRRKDTAENGTIVVALIDDEEVTLKRLRRSGNKIILEPENDDHEPRMLDPGRVKIQGVLAGLYRTYH